MDADRLGTWFVVTALMFAGVLVIGVIAALALWPD